MTWGQWRFHVRLDPRVGTVISLAGWQDGRGSRSVLYQGYLSEMFVPYMDPDAGWQSRTYFDTGEYGAGVLATPLERGVDCPATAAFLPGTFASDKGEAFTTPDALCVFERSLGEPIWRHRRRRQPDLRRPRRRRARGAHGHHHRQLRLPVRLGVHRQRGDRSPRRRHRHRRAEGRGDGAHERRDRRRRHEARHARRPEPRRRAPRSLLQLPPRSRHRRRRQQRQPGDLPSDDAARRLAAPQPLRRRADASPRPRRRDGSARTRRR